MSVEEIIHTTFTNTNMEPSTLCLDSINYRTIRHFVKPETVFIDIDVANIGDTIKLLVYKKNIYCIFIDPSSHSLLQEKSRELDISSRLDILNQIPQLDSLEINRIVSLIKIDTDIDELAMIKSSILIIEKYRPVIVLKIRNKIHVRSIVYLLSLFGYKYISLSEIAYIFYVDDSSNTFLESLRYNRINLSPQIPVDKKLYIEKIHREKMYRVKIMCNWCSSVDLCKAWSKMSKGDCKWNNIQVTHTDDDIDYYVIVNKPKNGDFYIHSKTIVFRMEPDTETSRHWNDWYKDKSDFYLFLDLSKCRNNTEWHLSLDHNTIYNSIEKSKTISSVVSSLYSLEGHKKRIDFLHYCEKNGVDIDIYGRDNYRNFKNYKGSLEYHSKDKGILPYKYSFISENCSVKNYYTEKIIDCIIGETLCFYWGCKNIDYYIDSRCFIKLPLDDMEQSLKIVKSSIQGDEWEKRLPYIREQKRTIVEYMNFFPRLERYINLHKYKFYSDNDNILESMGVYKYTLNTRTIIESQRHDDERHDDERHDGERHHTEGYTIHYTGNVYIENFIEDLSCIVWDNRHMETILIWCKKVDDTLYLSREREDDLPVCIVNNL